MQLCDISLASVPERTPFSQFRADDELTICNHSYDARELYELADSFADGRSQWHRCYPKAHQTGGSLKTLMAGIDVLEAG